MVLPPTYFGSAALPICLFFYGWSARESVHWIVPVIGSSFFTVSIITLFNPVLNYLGITYPKNQASIFAGNALFRASFGAIFPLLVRTFLPSGTPSHVRSADTDGSQARQLFRQLGIGPGNSLLGGIAVCFMPLPYIFTRYGKRIREMSRNARHDV